MVYTLGKEEYDLVDNFFRESQLQCPSPKTPPLTSTVTPQCVLQGIPLVFPVLQMSLFLVMGFPAQIARDLGAGPLSFVFTAS